jgi:hypothetical protein
MDLGWAHAVAANAATKLFIGTGARSTIPAHVGAATGNLGDAGYNISDDPSCRFAKTGLANNGDKVDPFAFACWTR